MTVEIELAGGYIALIDDEDYEKVRHFRWRALKKSNTTYAITSVRVDGRLTTLRLHRLIMNAPKGLEVDHVAGDGLDNRKAMLRLATHRQNIANCRKRTGTTSRFKGVSRHKGAGKWQAGIKAGDKRLHLGLYDNEVDAAKAYDAKARELWGEYAFLNFPDESADSLCAAERNAEPGKTKTLPLAANRISRVEPFNRLKNGVNTNAR